MTHETAIPDWAIDNKVTGCKSVEDFIDLYYKKERVYNAEYRLILIQSAQESVDNRGFASISRHDNITGKHITFIP